MLPDKVSPLLQEITRWASSQTDILAVALVGSHARKAARETSDVDLIILANQPDAYLKNLEWACRFGQVQHQQIEVYGKVKSVRVLVLQRAGGGVWHHR